MIGDKSHGWSAAAHLLHGLETADHLDAADYTCFQSGPAGLVEEVHLINKQQCHLCLHKIRYATIISASVLVSADHIACVTAMSWRYLS